MIEHGKIVNIEDNDAVVELVEHEECKNCKLCSNIGGKRQLKIELNPSDDFNIGQEVVIEISSGETLLGGFFIFILPLIAFIIGALIGPEITRLLDISFDPNLAAIICGLVLLAISLIVAAFIYRSEKKKKKLTPKMRVQ